MGISSTSVGWFQSGTSKACGIPVYGSGTGNILSVEVGMIEFVFDKHSEHLQNEMVRWCEENIGPGGWLNEPYYIWHVTAVFGNTFFMFEHEKDAAAFSLKWR